jgi:16S rRNA processing protein RimM
VEVLTDVDGRFLAGEILEAVAVDGRRRMLEILGSRSHRGQLLVRFRGIDDRDAAAEMRGASLEIAAHKSPDAPAGWYYYHQLVGCSCRDAEGGPLGVVDDVVEDGGGLLLSLLHGGQIILVPFVDEYIRAIDLEKGVIDLVLPRGLLELCVSPS